MKQAMPEPNIRCELVSGEDVSFLQGKLYTIIEAAGLPDAQVKGLKGTINMAVWDWFNYICDHTTDHKKEKQDWYKDNKELAG